MEKILTEKEFKELLVQIGPDGMVNYYLLEGVPHYFQDDWQRYMVFKEKIAKGLGIHPKSVLLVGSGRLGFSTAPGKRWRSFGEGKKRSDLDFVAVASELFDDVWRKLCEYEMTDIPAGASVGSRHRRMEMLYLGRIDPLTLPPEMAFCETCRQMFADLEIEYELEIKGWLYRDWWFVQRYYRDTFQQIYKDLTA